MARRRTKSGSSRVKGEEKKRERSAGLLDRTEDQSLAGSAGTQTSAGEAERNVAAVEPQQEVREIPPKRDERDQVIRSKTGAFLCIVTLARPGLVGLNKLARELNTLKDDGLIGDWHTEGWHDGNSQLRATIRFDTEADAVSAISRVGRPH